MSKRITTVLIAVGTMTLATAALSEESAEQPLVESGAEWSYFTGPTPLPPEWKVEPAKFLTLGTGQAPLGFNYPDIKTNLPYGDDAENKFPIAYFASEFEWDASLAQPGQEAITIGLSCDDGCIAYVNGEEVHRLRLPAGTPPAYSAQPVSKDVEFYSAAVPLSILKEGKNTVAVELHQQHPRSSDLRFTAKITPANPKNAEESP